MKPKKTVGILLAAGKSSRFKSNKCLHPLPSNAIPIGLQSAQTLSKAVDEVICIVPQNMPALQVLFKDNGFKTISNSLPDKGISESIKLGVEAIINDFDCNACIIALADMPYIKIETVQSIRKILDENNAIVAPIYQDKRGHPVGFSRFIFKALMALEGDQGAKSLIQQNHDSLHLLKVDDKGVISDIDVLTDLEKISFNLP